MWLRVWLSQYSGDVDFWSNLHVTSFPVVITHVASKTSAQSLQRYAKTPAGDAGASLMVGGVDTLGIHFESSEYVYSLILARSLTNSQSSVAFPIEPATTRRLGCVNLLVVPEQRVLLLTDLDGATTELGDQDLVAGLHADSNAVARLVVCAGADGKNLSLVQLLDGSLGKEDSCCGLGLGLEALHEHAVEEGGERADGLEGRLRCN